MAVRLLLLALLVAWGPAGVSAQDHGPAPAKPAPAAKPAAGAEKSAAAKDAHAAPKDAHAAPKDTHAAPKDSHAAPKDAHAAPKDAHADSKDAHGDAAAPAHGDDHAAPQDKSKPKPKVSSVTAPAPHGAAPHAAAPAADSHGPSPASKGGYVATGARKAASGGKGKAKPMVSAGAVPDIVPTKADAGHDAHGAPAASTSHAPATAHGGEPASGEAHAPATASSAVPPGGADAKKPAKLSDVHERLTEVLAGFHAEAHAGAGGANGAHGADGTDKASHGSTSGRRRAEGAAPRISVQWPGPRWTVAWPGPPRLTLTWPDAPAKAAAPRQADPH